MNQELFIALIAGLGGMLGWGLADFFAKKTIDQIGSISSLVWAHVFGTTFLISFAVFNFFLLHKQLNISSDLSVWAGLLFFGVLQAFVYLFAYEGFGKGQLAIINPIFASYSGLAVLISIIVFGESITLPLTLALIIIFIGVLLTSVDISGLQSKKLHILRARGLKEIALATVMAAFWQIFWDRFIGQDWMMYTLLMYGFMTLTAFAIAKVKQVSLSIKKTLLWKFLALIGFCEVIAYLSLSLGFSSTSYTSIVIILAGAFSLPTIILARIFLKEKLSQVQTIGSLVIVGGIILLSINR